MTKKKEKENLSDMSVDELIEKWKQVKELLDSLEDDYRKAEISESSYREAKEKNQRKFKQLTEILAGWGITNDQLESKPETGGKAGGGASAAEPGGDAGKAGGEAAIENIGAEAPSDETAEPPKTAGKEPAAGAQPERAHPQAQPAAAAISPPAQPSVSMDAIEAKIDARM